MRFSIEWDEQAADFLRKLPKTISERIIAKVDLLGDQPFRFLEHYECDCFKLRIGDYRALIDLNLEKNVVTIQVLDKRGRIYKR